MSNPIVPVVVIGGVAYALTQVASSPSPLPPTTGPKTVNVLELQQRMPAIANLSGSSLHQFGGGAAFTSTTSGPAVDPELQKKLDEIEAAAKQQYDNMSDVAKVEAIDRLNQNLGIDLPLDADLSWETISMAAYSAAGAAAGNAVCGPVCGKVGALAASYLGAQLNDLLAKKYDEVKSWLQDQLGVYKASDLIGGEQSITSYKNAYEAWKATRAAQGKSTSDAEWQAFRNRINATGGSKAVYSATLDDEILAGYVPV